MVYGPPVSRWQRYWFADGGRIAAAFVRIAIAASVLLTLERLATLSTVELPGPANLYRPVGPWMLLGHTIPPDPLITALWVLAWGGTIAMLLGLYTRASTAVSFVAAVALTSLSYASTATWSHQYNVVFLAQMAFLGARGGDVLSLDALIRRLRQLPPIDRARAYQWSLRLVQLAVALMFAGAAFHKLLHGHFTLRWALSDSLRHHLLVRYDLAGIDRPALVDWLLGDVWRYRTAALLNLIAQLTPIFACFFIRRPLVRALCGAVFISEVLGLGLVVSLWNLHWIPLAALFIDWDRLNAWLLRSPVPTDFEVVEGFRPPRGPRIFIVAFLTYDVITAFVPTLDQRLNTYPFSGFPMFATIRAAEPFGEHLPYDVPGDKYEVTSDHPLAPSQQRWFDHQNRRLYTVTDPKQVESRLLAMLDTAKRRYPELGIHAVRHYLAIFEAPAYPAPARFEPHPIAILAEVREGGTFRSVLGRFDGDAVELQPRGLDVATVQLVYYADDHPTPIALPATRDGNRFAVGKLAGDAIYVVALIEGTPWLVATKRAWKWQ
ncbi:MAG: hypothetical protein H6Q90_556 [Deltaproteobacteria bacterium]|nr:hypothetical protein [Deltaproteobacteria bacterium]